MDFKKLIQTLIPFAKRKPKIVAFIYALLSPIKALNAGSFKNLVDEIAYKQSITGQLIYLEKYLNDLYPSANGGIVIQDVANINVPYIYNPNENQTVVYIHNSSENATPVYIRNNLEILNEDKFIVKVPVTLSFVERIMRLQIDFYRIAGAKYSIITY